MGVMLWRGRVGGCGGKSLIFILRKSKNRFFMSRQLHHSQRVKKTCFRSAIYRICLLTGSGGVSWGRGRGGSLLQVYWVKCTPKTDALFMNILSSFRLRLVEVLYYHM